MSIVNLQRDGIWVKYSTATPYISFSGDNPLSDADTHMNADATVYDATANAQSDHTSKWAISAEQARCMGVFMRQPGSDNTPFRVKASAACEDSNCKFAIVVGVGPASPTGTDDAITDPVFIPFKDQFDDLIVVPYLDEADGDYSKPIGIGIAAYSDTAVASNIILANISVQRLATRPPTMATSVS